MKIVNKWMILALACIVTFGGYYSFDTPSALHYQIYHHFKTPTMSESDFEFYFSLIYSVYSLPNTFIPFFGGMMIDKFGNAYVMLLFGFLILLGNLIITISYLNKSINGFIIGRFIFGIGAETLSASSSTLISKWFFGSELAFAVALNLSFSKFASVLTDWVSPSITNIYGINWNSVTVSGLCLVCFLFTILLAYIEIKDYKNEIINSQNIENSVNNKSIIIGNKEKIDENTNLIQKDTKNKEIDYETINYIKTKNKERIKEKLNLVVWLVFIYTFIMYGIFMPFNNLSNAILLDFYFPHKLIHGKKLEEQEIDAAWLQSIPNFLSVFLTPIIGLGIDYFGNRSGLFLLSSFLLVFAHVLILLGAVNPIFPLSLIGVSYSIFSCVVWACIPVVTPESLHGTAYGVMVAFQNAGQFLVPLILQYLFSLSHSYISCEAFFIYFSLLSICVALLLWIVDEMVNHGKLRVFKLVKDGESRVLENDVLIPQKSYKDLLDESLELI